MYAAQRRKFVPSIISLATAYDDQSERDELVIPENLEGVEYADLKELYDTAVEQFDSLYADYANTMTEEQVATLAALTEGVEALGAEIAKRDAETAERAEKAAELASRVQKLRADSTEDGGDTEEDEEGEEGAEGEAPADEGEAEGEEEEDDAESAAQTITASAKPRSEVRVPLSSVKRKAPKQHESDSRPTMRDVAFSSGEGTGYAAGQGMDWDAVGRAIDRKLASFNPGQYTNAARAGKALREQHSIVSFNRQFSDDLTVASTDREHVDSVIANAVDQSRLPGGALVASGGWCAPSETLYDLLELETRSGLLSLPEVGIARGGISFTPGPSFADIFSSITGFSFTEEDDENGRYQPGEEGNVEGAKPCYHIECPDFQEVRLEGAGLCLTAGLLQQRGYPEVIARTVRGALVAHEHRMNSLLIQRLVAGSTAVAMGNKVGTAAPLLDAIEMQVEHYRYSHRLSDTATLEGVFPFWVRGAIRSDLSRRLGVELLSVTNQQINAWFTERGIAPQFVYNWQAIDTTAAGSFTAWPTSVSFLLYAAGTWVRGSSPIITLDTLYDSTLLSNNDYTALFTEEGWLVAKRGFDSRVVTVGIEANGATHQGIAIEHDGTAAVVEEPAA